jgi:hypothetical protein
VQGGVGTLAFVLKSVKRGASALIVSESGGAATAIFEYVTHEKAPGLVPDLEAFDTPASLATLSEIKHLDDLANNKLLTFFSLADGDDFSTQLLHTLINSLLRRGTPESAIRASRSITSEKASSRSDDASSSSGTPSYLRPTDRRTAATTTRPLPVRSR